MSDLIPDPDHPNQYIVGSAAEPIFGVQVGAQVLTEVHPPEACAGRHCTVHNPSAHHMRTWKLNWRGDRGIFERICPDNHIGHPDPDQFEYWRETGQDWQGVHGCDGCCAFGGEP